MNNIIKFTYEEMLRAKKDNPERYLEMRIIWHKWLEDQRKQDKLQSKALQSKIFRFKNPKQEAIFKLRHKIKRHESLAERARERIKKIEEEIKDETNN